MDVSLIVTTLIASFITALAATALVRLISLKRGFVSIPRDDRYSREVVALGGGIAIFAAIAAITMGGCLFVGKLGIDPADGVSFAIITCLITILFILGLIDDLRHLSPLLKLVIQFGVAFAAAIWADARVELFIENKLLTTFMSAFWIVMLINAFNFLDNMDGLSAGIAAISLSVLSCSAVLSGEYANALFMLVVIGSLIGFLVFNFPPAKIFMGDAGSFVIGFVVGVMTLKTTYYHQGSDINAPAAVFIPLVATAVPLYDFISVTILRLKQGKSPFVGDTQHFSHRLKRRGLSDTQVALTLYLATICTAIGAVFLFRAVFAQAVVIFIQTIMILAIIAILETTGGKCVSEE
jgi:UDP-GlcNAc:undecaprenyl-phosphate/decaprenyl-phosphate GlcNAc-1-phosphate transferase